MDTPLQQKLLRLGLEQIPTDGLVRLRRYLDAGRPIVTKSSLVAKRDARNRAYG